MMFQEFQASVFKQFLKTTALPESEIKKAIEEYKKEYSELKFQTLSEYAIKIAENAEYFSLKNRIVLAKYIIFGGK